MDASAVYFLISELCMSTTCGTLLLININLISKTAHWTGIPILSALGAEVAILFSILTLSNKVEKKWFFLAIAVITSITIFLESIRSEVQPKTIILMVSICLTIMFTLNYLICRFRLTDELRNNKFVKWFTWFELGMVGYGVVRILGYFSSAPIRPWDTPTTIALIIFSFYVVIGTFRYISYIGIRITWVSNTSPSSNSLNKTLAYAIEEKEQLLRGLIATNRNLGISALSSSLAHQLSQPLTTIALRADIIRRDLGKTAQDPRILTSLDEISTQSNKLAELVKNLRQLFSSRNSQFGPTNLQQITDEILQIVRPTLEANKINLLKSYETDPVVFGVDIQLQQVLINIINNAIDALIQHDAQDKKIFIGITNNEKFAIFEVKDNAGGIDAKILPSIFELYKSTKQGGLGVGLWLSRTIMEQHHGNVTAFNDANGYAIFKVEIPMSQSLENQ